MYSVGIPHVRLRYSPDIPLHTAVETMLGKLSSFKRASRSLAKTGLFFMSFHYLFVPSFLGRPSECFLRPWSSMWVPFGSLSGDFLSLFGGLWGFAGCHSLSSENLYFQLLEDSGRHFFVHFSRSGFLRAFLSFFMRIFTILV